MIDLIRSYLGTGASTEVVELTAAVLLISFVLLVCSMCFGILNKFFK